MCDENGGEECQMKSGRDFVPCRARKAGESGSTAGPVKRQSKHREVTGRMVITRSRGVIAEIPD